MKKRVDLLWLWISIVSFFMMSLIFIVMMLDSEITIMNNRELAITEGACFWAFLLLGIAAIIVLTVRRREWININNKIIKKRIGVISFFRNVPALIADIIFISSLIAFVVASIVTNMYGEICFVLLSIVVFSFCMHCILNGKIYHHIKHYL